MQYLLLIYEAEEIWENKSEEERGQVLARHAQLREKMNADGVEFTAQPLMPTATAVSLHRKNGQLQVSDGPFAETKEQLAGFYLFDVDSLEAAIEYAQMLPYPDWGTLELRPVAQHNMS